MQIQQWIDENGLKAKWLAEQLKIKAARFYKIVNGEITPTLQEALAIESYTAGKVTPEDFVQLQQQKKGTTNEQQQ